MRKITLLMIVIIVFNFICLSFFQLKVYASDSDDMSMYDFKQLDEGKYNINGRENSIDVSDSDIGSFASKCSTMLSLFSGVCAKLMSDIVNQCGFYYTDSDYSSDKLGIFTVNSLVFREYLLFNPKIYELSTDITKVESSSDLMKTIDDMKEFCSSIGKVINEIGIAFCLPLLILAITKTIMAKKADELAAWKKILVRWLLGLVLMFIYVYILIAIDLVSDSLVDFFWNIRKSLEEAGYSSFESTIEIVLINTFKKTGGVTSLAYSIEFLAIIVIQVLFFIIYAMRLFFIIFLFTIAPIVILIHSFNLILGKQSNVLGNFFKSYILLTFLQPLHELIYIVFIFSLSEIAINVPALGIVLLLALYRAQNIIKAMFGWELGSSILSFKD